MRSTALSKRGKKGCMTCRMRRIKCDETKPACTKCSSTGRKCDGYSTLPFSRRDLEAASRSYSPPFSGPERQDGVLPRLITDPAFEDVLSKRYYQFFRQRTVASTNSVVDSRFWDRVVLQACHAEPTIKHAVLGLSALHQLSASPPGSEIARQHLSYAERQYQIAVQKAQVLIGSATPQNLDCVLIACIVFICFESARGNDEGYAAHMDSGRRILKQNAEKIRHASRRKDLEEIKLTLARLDLHFLSVAEHSSTYWYRLKDCFEFAPDFTSPNFKDVHEAQAVFVDLCRWNLVLNISVGKIEKEGADPQDLQRLFAAFTVCENMVEQWGERFERAVAANPSTPDLLVKVLRLWYAMGLAWVRSGMSGPQIKFDRFQHLWERVVVLGEELVDSIKPSDDWGSFSVDMGYLVPLYVVASKCRDPIIRRRAIQLMRAQPRQEGHWDNNSVASLAESLVVMEEDVGGPVTSAEDIPNHKRVCHIDSFETTFAEKGFSMTDTPPDEAIIWSNNGYVQEERLNQDHYRVDLVSLWKSNIRKSLNHRSYVSAYFEREMEP